jgi:hypothetical protein
MSDLNRTKLAGDDADKAQQSPRKRHKRYRVPREARGKDFERFGIPGASCSYQRREAHSPDPVPATNALATNSSTTSESPASALALLAEEWENVSEKGVSLLAAKNAIRFWCSAVLIVLFILSIGHSGWVWRVFDWMQQIPVQPR